MYPERNLFFGLCDLEILFVHAHSLKLIDIHRVLWNYKINSTR
jgi:hypothetical protein